MTRFSVTPYTAGPFLMEFHKNGKPTTKLIAKDKTTGETVFTDSANFNSGKARDGVLDRWHGVQPLTNETRREILTQMMDFSRISAENDAADETESPSVPGRVIEVERPEPWPEPVDGAALLAKIVGMLRLYCIVPTGGVEVAAAWIFHTFAPDAAYFSPFLVILAPEKRSGKSRLLGLIESLAHKAIPVSNISGPALFRTIDKYYPCTLSIDEFDTFLAQNEELRGILNAGHDRRSFVLRCVGDNLEVRAFSTYGPKLLSGIGRPPDTIADRSIIIPMKRRTQDEIVDRLRMDRFRDECREPCRQLMRWAQDHETELKEADPEPLVALDDRANDNVRCLLAIADVVGGEWPKRIRAAVMALRRDGASDDASPSLELLRDLRDEIVPSCRSERIATADLLSRLHALDDRPWAAYGRHQRPINASELSRLLKRYDVQPTTMRIDGGKPIKGYIVASLLDPIKRYIGLPAVTAVTTVPGNKLCDSQSVTSIGSVTPPESLNALPDHGVTDVTGRSSWHERPFDDEREDV